MITEIVQLDKMQVLQLLKSLQSDDLVTIAIYDMDPREKRIGLEKARKRRPDGRKSRPSIGRMSILVRVGVRRCDRSGVVPQAGWGKPKSILQLTDTFYRRTSGEERPRDCSNSLARRRAFCQSMTNSPPLSTQSATV